MELELGLALPNHSPMITRGLDLNCNSNGLEMGNCKDCSPKRVFLEDHGVGVETYGSCPPKWRKIHVDDDDDECQEIEGWPPINSLWKEPPPRRRWLRKSMHVKVKMEGVAIGRKIDLRHYDSYQALTNTLIHMFAKYSKIEKNMEEYTLSYQDKEGDWMLVGDVQWEMFVESVQRVEIIKNNNRMGFRLLSRKS